MSNILYITTNADSGAGSLRDVVNAARPGDVIRPDETVFERGATVEIFLASPLVVSKNLAIEGGPFRVRLDGGGAVGCVVVATGVNVSFTSFDFVGGVASQNDENDDENGNGGGLRVERGANVVLSRCRVCGCDAAQYGGGIYVDDAASLTLADSAVFGNRAQDSGGGLYLAASSNFAPNGATVAANVDAASNGWADVVAEYGFDATSQTPRNSIVGAASSGGSALYDATSTTAAGSVVGVSVGEVGFVAPGGVSAPFESWSRNAWQSIDLRLLDDASPNPSPYRDAGGVDNMTRYDVQGNFRGRETGGAASCSPGAYETLQADLFWVGVDASGAPVASPTLLNADGWATSRFASASGDAAPQLGQTLFVDGVVSFSGVLSTTSTQTFGLTLGGGAVVTFEPIQIVYCSTFTLGAGSTFGGLRGRLIGPRQRLRFGANARIDTTTLRISINDVWFDAGGYVASCECYATAPPEPRYGALSILRTTDATPRLNGAYFCESFRTARSGDSASYSIPTAPETSIRCRSFEYKLDFAEGRLFTNAVVVELYGNATATVSRTGTTTLDFAADFAVDATDATSAALTLDGQAVYGDASNAAVALTGSAKIDERGLVVASLTVADGAAVDFSGVDAVLSATESATVGSATFAGTGYFATPPGTDLTAATFAETIRVVDFSAGVADFTATANGPTTATLAWSATDAGATVCAERETATGWEVVDARASSTLETTIITPGVTRFRLFDGEKFLYDVAWYLTGDQFTAAGFCYATTTNETSSVEYATRGRIVATSSNGLIYYGQSVTFIQRIANAFTGELLKNDGGNVTAVKYSLYKRETGLFSTTANATAIFENRDAPTTCVLEAPQTSEVWDEDGAPVEYNFVLTPPNSITEPFLPSPGEYFLRVAVELSSGNPIISIFEFSVL